MIDLIWEKILGKNKALVIVTHDLEIAARADKMYRLTNGVLINEKA